jgi:hypothetical protein
MVVYGTITLTGEFDPADTVCQITSWPSDAIGPGTGLPDHSATEGMIGWDTIDCPVTTGVAAPYGAFVPMASEEEVYIIAKIETGGGTMITEAGTSSNPLGVILGGESFGFDFVVELMGAPTEGK